MRGNSTMVCLFTLLANSGVATAGRMSNSVAHVQELGQTQLALDRLHRHLLRKSRSILRGSVRGRALPTRWLTRVAHMLELKAQWQRLRAEALTRQAGWEDPPQIPRLWGNWEAAQADALAAERYARGLHFAAGWLAAVQPQSAAVDRRSLQHGLRASAKALRRERPFRSARQIVRHLMREGLSALDRLEHDLAPSLAARQAEAQWAEPSTLLGLRRIPASLRFRGRAILRGGMRGGSGRTRVLETIDDHRSAKLPSRMPRVRGRGR